MVFQQKEPKKIYIRVQAQPITTAGIYHNSDLGLISLSSDGSNWITISDKNLGATQVYNDGDTLSQDNCGNFYQWGNNYGFSYSGTITTSGGYVDASTYGPGNYYYSSTFITINPRDYSYNDNLRGGTTGTNVAMKGPCAEGYHIPTNTEWQSILDLGTSMGAWSSSTPAQIISILKLPLTGMRMFNSGNLTNPGLTGVYRTCIFMTSPYAAYSFNLGSSTAEVYRNVCPTGNPIRPFKNDAVQPDDSRTKLY